MNPKLSRRDFSTKTLRNATGIAIGTQLPFLWQQSAVQAAESSKKEKILVVIQLSGGNDGLNTVIPYSDEAYYKARPKLGIAKNQVIKTSDRLGLHPSLRPFEELLSDKRISILHGVGYENPNRSHFESMDIWHTCARKESRSNEGWLGRMFAAGKFDPSDAPGIHLGSEILPVALSSRGVQVPSIASVEEMRLKSANKQPTMHDVGEQLTQQKEIAAATDSGLLDFVSTSTQVALQASQQIEKTLSTSDSSYKFPDSGLGEKLKIVARLILAGLRTRVYYVTLDGFDTHANQPQTHQGLLKQWADALAAFHSRLASDGQSDRVLVMSFSEFGRRLAENASDGTDHGAAAPVFLSGPQFLDWQVGAMPSLSELEDGDIKYHTDFRRVYSTVLQNWLGQSSLIPLAGNYEPLKNVFAV